MSTPAFDAVVVSHRSLIRELLAALLRARGLGRVAVCPSLRESLTLAASAAWFVLEDDGTSDEFSNYQESLQQLNPRAQVLRIEETSDAAALDAIFATIRPAAPRTPRPHDLLTPLELEVMLSVATGLRNADVARRMRRSAKTVEKHRANALRKLGFRNVAQLTAYALRHDLLDGASILGPPAG